LYRYGSLPSTLCRLSHIVIVILVVVSRRRGRISVVSIRSSQEHSESIFIMRIDVMQGSLWLSNKRESVLRDQSASENERCVVVCLSGRSVMLVTLIRISSDEIQSRPLNPM
jgi:hypothetical protein